MIEPRSTRAAIRRKALHAAASVALASGLSACLPPVDDKAAVDTELDSVLLVDTDVVDSLWSDTEAVDTQVVDTQVVDSEAVDSEVDDTVVVEAAPTCDDVPPEDWVTCCDALRAWCNQQHPSDLDAENTCTFGPNFDGSTGCIPWGPPAPPAMRLA